MEREKTKRQSWIRSTKWGFAKRDVRGFRYRPRRDWFVFCKERKLCFFCSSKQTLVFASPSSSAGKTFKYGYLSFKNAWICFRRRLFTPRSRERHGLLWMCALYLTTFGLLKKNTTLILALGRARIIFYIKIRLNEEIHIHLDDLRVSK